MITSPNFSGKRYGVFGLARSGLATVRALTASGAQVIAWDDRRDARDAVVGAEIIDLNTADLKALKLDALVVRSEEHTSELQSLMRLSYAVFCLEQNNEEDTL